MSSDALRHGFRAVLRDPALLLIEIGWRWIYGAIALLICGFCVFLLLGSITVDPRRLEALRLLSPVELMQTISAALTALGLTLWRYAVFAGVLLTICWIVLSALGRYATLTRPALAPGADLKKCFGLSIARALIAVACILIGLAATFLAGFAAIRVGYGGRPSVLLDAILLPVFLLLVLIWVVSNWYLSMASLFAEDRWTKCVVAGWTLARDQRDGMLEVSVVTASIRALLFVAALMLSAAVSSVVTNPRMLIPDLFAILLLYCFCVDFILTVRLAALAAFRDAACIDARAEVDPGIPVRAFLDQQPSQSGR